MFISPQISLLDRKTKTNVQDILAFKNIYQSLFLLVILTIFSSCSASLTRKKTKTKTVNKAIAIARKYTGVKYKWGGTSRKGLDCSGLMYLAWKGAGKKIPRTSKTQSVFGKPVKKSKVHVGDMVFFRKGRWGGKVTHVGMVTYVSSKRVRFIHASSSRGVIEDNLLSNYWSKRYIKARRVVN